MGTSAGRQHDEQAGEHVHDDARPALDPNGPTVAPVHEVLRSATPVGGRAFGNDPLGGTSAGDDVTEVLRRRQGRGDTLPTDVAQNLGEKLGTPLDDVRVHHDQEADGVARSMQATAFTYGTDIYFTRGTYDPHGKGGQHLLAHELAHVTQHRRGGGGGASHGGPVIGRADDPAEAEADRIAADVVSGKPAAGVAPAGDAVRRCRDSHVIHRKIGDKLPTRVKKAATKVKQGAARIATSVKKAAKKVGKKISAALSGKVSPKPVMGAAPAPKPTGSSRKHRAFAVAQLGEAYATEKGSTRGELGQVVKDECAIIACAWKSIKVLEGGGGGGAPEAAAPAAGNAYLFSDQAQDQGSAYGAYGDYNNLSEDSGSESESEDGKDEVVYNQLDPEDGAHENNDLDLHDQGQESGEGEQESEEDKDGGPYNNVADLGTVYSYPSSSDAGPEEEQEQEEESEDGKDDSYNNVSDLEEEQESEEEDKDGGPDNDVADLGTVYSYNSSSDAGPEQEQEEESEDGKDDDYNNVDQDGPAPYTYQLTPSSESGEGGQGGVVEPTVYQNYYAGDAAPADAGPASAPSGAAALAQAAALWRTAGYPNTAGKLEKMTPAEALAFCQARHSELLTKLRREDLDIADDGTLRTDLAGRTIGYDETADLQQKTLVTFEGGKLKRSAESGRPGDVSTADGVTHFSGAGYEIFVVSSDNEIHMADHKIGKYHHSSLLGGKEVAMAGEMRVEGGVIQEMSGKSGHYRPTRENCVQFLHWLEKDGIPLDFNFGGFGETPVKASDYVLGIDHTGATSPDNSYEGAKTNVVIESFAKEYGMPAVLEAMKAHGWKSDAGKIVDEFGAPVPLQDVRRALKAEFGRKAPQKLMQDTSDHKSRNVSWR